MKNPGSVDSRNAIEIFPPTIRRVDEHIRLIVELGIMNKRQELWYQFPAEYEKFVSSTFDPFVVAVLFPAMEKGLDIKVHGEVSQSLLENIGRFQEVWHKWDSGKYRKTEIIPDAIAAPPGPREEHVAMMFSGGLDSCYTAWKHASSHRKPQTALFVLGFDIPLEEPRFFDSYCTKAKAITDSIQVDLIPVQFNFRKLVGEWEMSHGTALTSCLHLFSGLFTTGLIASSHAYDSLRLPWGSNPLTDPLLSSDRLRIINDGGECSRWEKAEAIAEWMPAMEHLRVCYKGKEKDRNCGVCSNCLLTALGFAASGKNIPAALNISTAEEAIRKLYSWPLLPMGVVRMDQMAAFADQRKVRADWLTEFKACARFHKKRLKLAKPVGKMLLLRNKLRSESCGAGSVMPSGA